MGEGPKRRKVRACNQSVSPPWRGGGQDAAAVDGCNSASLVGSSSSCGSSMGGGDSVVKLFTSLASQSDMGSVFFLTPLSHGSLSDAVGSGGASTTTRTSTRSDDDSAHGAGGEAPPQQQQQPNARRALFPPSCVDSVAAPSAQAADPTSAAPTISLDLSGEGSACSQHQEDGEQQGERVASPACSSLSLLSPIPCAHSPCSNCNSTGGVAEVEARLRATISAAARSALQRSAIGGLLPTHAPTATPEERLGSPYPASKTSPLASVAPAPAPEAAASYSGLAGGEGQLLLRSAEMALADAEAAMRRSAEAQVRVTARATARRRRSSTPPTSSP